MKIHVKSLIVALAVAGMSSLAVAAGSAVEVGVNVSDKMPRGTAENIQVIVPLSQFLSAKSGQTMQIVPERRMTTFKNQIRSGYYPVLYVNPELASVAVEMGYKPQLKTTFTIDSVIMMRADANVNSWAELYGKKIISQDNSLVKTIAEAAMYKTGTTGLVDYRVSKLKTQRELFDSFSQGNGDGIVIRGRTAEQLIEQNPGKFKIALRAGSVPAFMMLTHPSMPETQVASIKRAFLELNKPENKELAATLENNAEPGYVDVQPEDFSVIREVMNIVEPDYKLATPAKK